MENTGAFPELARLVPTADQEVRGGIEDTLDETDQEANSNDLVATARSSKTESQDCPYKLTAWDPNRGPNFGEDELGRELPDDIACSPRHIYQVQLVRVHGEVLFHSITCESPAADPRLM